MTSGSDSRPTALFLSILTALVPLAFAAPLFEPFLETKELLLVAGAAGAAALWLATGGWRTVPRTPVWAALGVVAAAAAVSRPSVPATAHFLGLLLLAVVAASEMREPAARAALSASLALAGCIEALYVLTQALAGDPLFSAARLAGKWRAFGTLGNPNWAGEFLAVALLVAWGRASARRQQGGRTRALDTACVTLIAAGLAATFARGAWLACALAALGFWLARHRKTAAPAAATAVAGVFAAVALAVVLLRPDTVAYLLNTASLRGRVWMWIVSARMIAAAPWAGFGLGSFGMVFPRYQAEAFTRPWAAPFLTNGSFTPHAHNDFLQLWAEAGILAAFGLAALAWIAVRRGRALAGDPLALGCWAALLSLLVNAAFSSPLYLPGSAAVLAVLLGTVEGAAAGQVWKFSPAMPARAAACVLAAVLCAAAWPYCWRRAKVDAAVGRASAAISRGDHASADAALKSAVALDPSHMEAWSLTGRLRFDRGQYAASAEAFERALRLGYDPEVFEGRAGALWKSGRRAEAMAVLEELVRLRPDLPWAARELRLLRAVPAAQPERSPS